MKITQIIGMAGCAGILAGALQAAPDPVSDPVANVLPTVKNTAELGSKLVQQNNQNGQQLQQFNRAKEIENQKTIETQRQDSLKAIQAVNTPEIQKQVTGISSEYMLIIQRVLLTPDTQVMDAVVNEFLKRPELKKQFVALVKANMPEFVKKNKVTNLSKALHSEKGFNLIIKNALLLVLQKSYEIKKPFPSVKVEKDASGAIQILFNDKGTHVVSLSFTLNPQSQYQFHSASVTDYQSLNTLSDAQKAVEGGSKALPFHQEGSFLPSFDISKLEGISSPMIFNSAEEITQFNQKIFALNGNQEFHFQFPIPEGFDFSKDSVLFAFTKKPPVDSTTLKITQVQMGPDGLKVETEYGYDPVIIKEVIQSETSLTETTKVMAKANPNDPYQIAIAFAKVSKSDLPS